MPTHYGLVTKFPTATQDFFCAAVNLGSGGAVTIPYTLFRFGSPPLSSSALTNPRGFVRVPLPAGTTDGLLKVDLPLSGCVLVHQVQTSGGTGVLYVAYPDESVSLGVGFEIPRIGGVEFALLGNKWTFAANVTVFSRGGPSTPVSVQPQSVLRVNLPTLDTYVRLSSNLALVVQTGLGNGYQSTLMPRL